MDLTIDGISNLSIVVDALRAGDRMIDTHIDRCHTYLRPVYDGYCGCAVGALYVGLVGSASEAQDRYDRGADMHSLVRLTLVEAGVATTMKGAADLLSQIENAFEGDPLGGDRRSVAQIAAEIEAHALARA